MKLKLMVLAFLLAATGVLSGCKGEPKPPSYATATVMPYPGYP
jgi:hypothetical protein